MIKESLILPSQGYPYKGKLEGTSIMVRPLTTKAYKDFLISGGEEGVTNLVDSCLVDSPIKAEDLVYQDELAIYLKIRSMSLGSNIPVYSVCPGCGEKNVETWDLMQLDCSYLYMDEYPITVTLPESQKKVSIRIPTAKSQRIAREEAQKRATKFDKKLADFLSSFQIASVLHVDGVGDIVQRADWYTELPLRDAVYIDQVLAKIQDFGIHTTRETECKSCKRKYTVPLQVTSDFFRPSIGDIEGVKVAKGTLAEGPKNSTEIEQDS